MLKHIRAATKDEIEQVREKAHFTPETAVFAMDQNDDEPDICVVRMLPVLDPVFFGKHTNDVQKAKLIWAMEERMAGSGLPIYYFNVLANDLHWQKVVEGWGAIKVSEQPELQYKKELK